MIRKEIHTFGYFYSFWNVYSEANLIIYYFTTNSLCHFIINIFIQRNNRLLSSGQPKIIFNSKIFYFKFLVILTISYILTDY